LPLVGSGEPANLIKIFVSEVKEVGNLAERSVEIMAYDSALFDNQDNFQG